MSSNTPKRFCALAATVAVSYSLFASVANAQQKTDTYGGAVKIGTLGVSLEGDAMLSQDMDARLSFGTLNYKQNRTMENINFNTHFNFNNILLTGNYYPGGPTGSFYLSFGIVNNNNSFNGTGQADASGGYTINGKSYTAAQVGTLVGRVSYAKTEPYLGIGFGRPTTHYSAVQFGADLGIILGSQPKFTLSNTGGDASLPNIQTDIAAQEATTQSDLDKMKVYPVIQVGVAFHF